jgi:hypothetical protein
LNDRFLPEPREWLKEWNASVRTVVDCQRGFFDALADRFTRAHWEVEWDAQPFRISAVPPRTIGKMIHQLVTANYFHLTLPPHQRPPLRRTPLPGSTYLRTSQPGFRWNVLDYGMGNVFSDPLATGHRCEGVRSAWHCVWQRFPHQQSVRTPPSAKSALGQAAQALYNTSMSGSHAHSVLQYLVIGGVSQVFSELAPAAREYLSTHLTMLCHVPGPHCGGTPDFVSARYKSLANRHSQTKMVVAGLRHAVMSLWPSSEKQIAWIPMHPSSGSPGWAFLGGFIGSRFWRALER